MFVWILCKRAREFATHNFSACDVHPAEAIAVHQALQRLCENDLQGLEPVMLVRQILPAPVRVPASVFHNRSKMDSLDRIKLAVAIEEEQGSMSDSAMGKVLNDL